MFKQTLGLIGLTLLLKIRLSDKILPPLTDLLGQIFQAETWLHERALITTGLLARIWLALMDLLEQTLPTNGFI